MSRTTSRINLTVVAGILLLCNLFFNNFFTAGKTLVAVILIILAATTIVVGLINRRLLYVITLLLGLTMTISMLYAYRSMIVNGENFISVSAAIFACLIVLSGVCSIIGAVKELIRKKRPVIVFDFDNK